MTKITGEDHIRIIKLLYLNLSYKCSRIYIERNVFMCTMKKKMKKCGKWQSAPVFNIVCHNVCEKASYILHLLFSCGITERNDCKSVCEIHSSICLN